MAKIYHLIRFFFKIFILSNKITPFESFRLREKELVKSESKKVIIVTNDVQKDNSNSNNTGFISYLRWVWLQRTIKLIKHKYIVFWSIVTG